MIEIPIDPKKITSENNIKTPETFEEKYMRELKFKEEESLQNEVKVAEFFKKKNEETFDLLPLPFLEKLKMGEIQKISLTNHENTKKWKDFIDRLPSSQYETVPRQRDKYWRWKMYKKYIPEERINFRKTLSIGPKMDQFGRLPIPEELNKFRISRENNKKPEKFKTYLKKGDGLRKLQKKNNEK